MSTRLMEYLPRIIIPAVFSTLKMLIISFFFSLFFGFILGSVLVYTHPSKGLKPNKKIYRFIDIIIGLIRSFPVIILMVALTPITKMIVGTSIGEIAAVVPITFATTPVVARNIENILLEIDRNVVLAAKSFGANNWQILSRVMYPEALPSIISSLTSILIMCLGTTTIAGAIGAGGLGAVALNYGYQRFDNVVMYTIVFLLFLIVLLIEILGKQLYKKTNKNIGGR